jgi:transposase, IS30 family
VHTITFDNGKDFAAHQDIAHALKAKIFFATPYHAWERGLNENTNRFIRDFFPKAVGIHRRQTIFSRQSDD